MKIRHKRLLFRISASALMFAAVFAVDLTVGLNTYLKYALYLIPYLTVGYDIIFKAFVGITGGHPFDENFLMCIATFGAFGIGELPEAVFVMLFYQTGELFQSIAVGKSRSSIAALMDIKPDKARVIRDGTENEVAPEEIMVGEMIVVRPGEKIPLDGEITEGESELDYSKLTGESIPVYAEPGDKVSGGAICMGGVIKIKVSSEYKDSTVKKILDLVENAFESKAKTDRLITRFSAVYTPVVVISALLLFLIPSIVTKDPVVWLSRALVFLVISCPCALVLSVPLSYFGGIGAASRNGILIKGSVYLESLADVTHVVFDKTGTLTKGKFKVSALKVMSKAETANDEICRTAYALEKGSNHPIAMAVTEYCKKYVTDNGYVAVNVNETAGMGVTADINGKCCFAGNAKLLKKLQIDFDEAEGDAGIIYVGSDKKLLGYFEVEDEIKEEAGDAIRRLKDLGIKKTVMLSGDRKSCVDKTAKALSIDRAAGELLPADKVDELKKELSSKPSGKKLVYVGDGINDAPVLGMADIGISMGAMGSDAAIEAADVVLMDDNPQKIVSALRIAKKTKRIVIENIVFALVIKLFFLVLGAFGKTSLWEATFADVGVMVIAVLNSMRTLKLK